MAKIRTKGSRIVSICTCVPETRFDNLGDQSGFSQEEVRKVTAMAGVSARRVADKLTCTSDLCEAAAKRVLEMTGWEKDSVDALIMVTQTPDYFLPSTSCVLQAKLGLSDHCAAFDVGLGCSSYTYGLYLAAVMLQAGGMKRVLLLTGETPSHFTDKSDRAVYFLFGDAGSATAIEKTEGTDDEPWSFVLQTDGTGYGDLIIEAGGFRDRFNTDRNKHNLYMNGANIFNFTLKRVPPMIQDTLTLAGMSDEDIDYYIFHQSNRFIIKHLMKKMQVSDEKVPLILEEYGNTGGVSVALTITLGGLERKPKESLDLMLLGYGVGLSWASALVKLDPYASLDHVELPKREEAENDEKSTG